MSDELILAISGNDIFSGGGLHADLATFTTNKQHGFVALTCLTAMTENGFEVIPVDSNVFKQQLDSLKDLYITYSRAWSDTEHPIESKNCILFLLFCFMFKIVGSIIIKHESIDIINIKIGRASCRERV